MATASVSNLPVCSICRESFTIPKVLPCGHSFCLPCLERVIVDNIETFPCPYCKHDVEIPEDGAHGIATNYAVEEIMVCLNDEGPTPSSSDSESDETRNKAIENLQRSQTIIQNRIKNLKKNRSTLLESFEQLKSLCEDSCTKVDEQREQIVSDLGKHCEKIKLDIRKSLDENRSKVDDRRNEITGDLDVLEREIESNISPSTKTTKNILQTLPRLIEIVKQDESMKDYNLFLQYLQWVGKDFSLDIDQLGSVITKSFYIQGSYQFLYRLTDIQKSHAHFLNIYKIRNNNLVFRCNVADIVGDISIGFALFQIDNPGLNYCIFDGQIRLLNIDDESKSLTTSCQYNKLVTGEVWKSYPITRSRFMDKNNGSITSNNQFVIQFDITKIREISWK